MDIWIFILQLFLFLFLGQIHGTEIWIGNDE